MSLVSGEQEAQLGAATFAQIQKEERVSTNPQYNAQVDRVGQRIAAAVGREVPGAEWDFIVFESDQVNAFALPGGKVGVYTGLLKLVESDDELATVSRFLHGAAELQLRATHRLTGQTAEES